MWVSPGLNFVHKRKEMGGACSRLGERCVEVLVSKHEEKIPLGRRRRRWECNTKMVLQVVVWGLGLNLSASV